MPNIRTIGNDASDYRFRLIADTAQRRKAVFEKLPADSVAVFLAATPKLRNGDCHYGYRQDSSLLYLTALEEPGCAIVLSNLDGVESYRVFARPRDAVDELWNGPRLGPDGARLACAADRGYDIGNIARVLSPLLRKASRLYLSRGVDTSLEAKLTNLATRCEISSDKRLDAVKLIADGRLLKSALELDLMDTSAAIAAHAHNVAMAQCHAGMTETQLNSYIEHTFTVNGATGPAYGSIVASGASGLCLHHNAGSGPLVQGEMVLVDAGCEYGGYASDITRTYPVSGQFSQAQREIYDLVLDAQLQAINLVRPGEVWSTLDKMADTVILQGLQRLGFDIVNGDGKGRLTLDDVLPHGLGHWLGMDVHDLGDKKILVGKVKQERRLQPGMVLTIEPGIYLSATDERIPARYRGIAVRIEDDVVVTTDGCRVITAAAIKAPDEIERFMAAAKQHRLERGAFTPVVTAKLAL